ncbi:hypothetical protein ACLB2K_025813 [Fragaria x ananassa]
MRFVGANDRGSALPNLWVFCKTSLAPWIRVCSTSDQQVSLQVMFDSVNCFLTAVYARTTISGRRKLWEDITDFKGRFVTGPWLVFGDFNAVLGAHEKKGGAPLCRRSCEEFQAMSDVCELIHVDTKGAEFTWVRRRGFRGNVELRLDRSLANLNWMEEWDQFDCCTLPRTCSDHNPLLMSFSKFTGPRFSLFRFRKMWLEHKDFMSFVKGCWSSTTSFGCPYSVLQCKLRTLRKSLRTWNWEVFGDVHRRVEFDLAALADIQNKITASGGSDEEFEKETELQAILNESIRHQKILWREKSRLRWLSEEYEDSGLVSKVIHSMVIPEENTMLTSVPLSEEIWAAVKSMDPDSAPGPDGFNGHFFVSCWDVVGADVVKVVQYFFQHGYLAPSFNSGRNISDCILTTSECFNLLNSKCHGGNLAIKVDITKAFDTLSWDFLLHVLQAFGFDPIFVQWVRALLLSAKLSLLITGKTVGYFSYERGVRQGDPLSPLLFCLAEEVLSRGISLLVSSGQLQRISSPRNTLAPSHVLFADDVIVFCRGNRRNLSRIMRFFNEYGRVSGQVINKGKSQVFIGNSIHSRRHSISNFLGIPLGSAPFMYLGAPIFYGKPRASYFHQIVDKIRIKLSSWVSSSLSMAGRLQLIKSVIFSMLVYTFQVYEWPVSVVRKIEVWCRNFLWSGSIDKRGIPLVAWKSCCSPIAEGGLGLKQLVLLNRSLLLKRCWEIYTAQSEGCAFIPNRFSRRKSYAPSSIWPGVRQFWKTVQDNSQWLIGSGNGIYFWRDKFMGRPINEFFGSNVLMQDNSDLVSKYIDNGSWNLPPLLQLHYPALCGMINQVPVSEDPSVNDKLIWTSSASGELTAKQAYTFMRHSSNPRRGIPWVSRCELCGVCSETLNHTFLSCSFTAAFWSHFGSIFELGMIPSSILELYGLGLQNGRSPQLMELWLICFTSILWFVWHVRNKTRFDGCRFSVEVVCTLISSHIRATSHLTTGHMHNSVQELRILKCFGAPCRPRATPRVVEVNWIPPSLGWVKINSDGSWKHEEGVGGYGAIFRDYKGHFLGAFASNLEIPSSISAEIMAVIKAIELAWVRDWKHIWLEVDSSLVLDYIRRPSLVPWPLRVRWLNCLYRISKMNFKATHIFREGNKIADALANQGTSCSELI